MREPVERIVCLTEETTELLYLLGEEARIVGVSAYTVRPAHARRTHPVVSAFTDGSAQKIVALKPDLVIGFSEVQARFAAELIGHGLAVLIFNQRSIEDILQTMQVVGRMVGAEQRARSLVSDFSARLAACRARTASRKRPRVYFEEWYDPMISCIRWVSELIEVAGGEDVFANLRAGGLARERTVTPEQVCARDPEVILASWCGKPFKREQLEARPGFAELSAVRSGRVFEVDPSIILQPGAACLSDGLDALERLIGEAG